MKNMGMAKRCLNININQSDGKIELDQTTYIKKILKCFNMVDCKPILTPSDTNQRLSVSMCSEGKLKEEKIPNQEAVGSLNVQDLILHLQLMMSADFIQIFVLHTGKQLKGLFVISKEPLI